LQSKDELGYCSNINGNRKKRRDAAEKAKLKSLDLTKGTCSEIEPYTKS
jgi:hypothetical protein